MCDWLSGWACGRTALLSSWFKVCMVFHVVLQLFTHLSVLPSVTFVHLFKDTVSDVPIESSPHSHHPHLTRGHWVIHASFNSHLIQEEEPPECQSKDGVWQHSWEMGTRKQFNPDAKFQFSDAKELAVNSFLSLVLFLRSVLQNSVLHFLLENKLHYQASRLKETSGTSSLTLDVRAFISGVRVPVNLKKVIAWHTEKTRACVLTTNASARNFPSHTSALFLWQMPSATKMAARVALWSARNTVTTRRGIDHVKILWWVWRNTLQWLSYQKDQCGRRYVIVQLFSEYKTPECDLPLNVAPYSS